VARRARRSPLLAPLALLLLVVCAAVVGIAATKALPSSARPKAGAALGAHRHGTQWIEQGYPGAPKVAVKTADVTPTAYSEPTVIKSRHGVLHATFIPHVGTADINGQTYSGVWTFTNTFPGPTLKINPGDTIKLDLVNRLTQNTNLHFHGFRASPSGIADNVLRTIYPAVTTRVVAPDKSAKIVVHVPKGHEQGLYWYHPHMHGNTDPQVYSGLSGLIIIGDVLKHFPWLHHIKQRVMAMQSVELGADGSLVPVEKSSVKRETNLVNGHYQPTLTIRPGELQLWRIANISNENWYQLYLNGLKFYVIGEDGNPVGHTWSQQSLLVPPAKRFEFLVRGPPAGKYELDSLAFNQGHIMFGQFKFLNLISQGKPVAKKLRIPKIVSRQQQGLIRDELNDKVDAHRTLTFTIKPPFPDAFYIDNKLFDPKRIDEKVSVGTTEEWLLVNPSSEDHPFHIHTNDFLVEKVNGHRVSIHGFQDTVKIEREINGKPGTVLIRMRFRRFQGLAVFHCHILFHEDHSMMGVIQFGKREANPSNGAGR
jgi:suppressor of ftsI